MRELGVTKLPIEKSQALIKTARPKKESEDKQQKFKFALQTLTFKDVIGMKRPKALIHKLLELPIKKPEAFAQLQINKSQGIILYGPPGTGKTLICKAACGELEIKVCYTAPSNIMSKYVGESAQNVEEIFKQARKNEPCAIFIDEADILLQNRDAISSEGGSSELKQAVSQMLVETSKIHDDKRSHVYLLAATNQPWDIDIAHRRSGRFEYTIYVAAPTFWDRRRMIEYYIKKGSDEAPEKFGRINYTLLALATMNYSGADLEKICKIAKINALEKQRILVTTRSVQKALWSKEGGTSSLDPWYTNMKSKYLPKKKSKIKWLLFKKYREKELDKTKNQFDKADTEIYKEMVDDINNYMRKRWAIRLIRVFGRGLPILQVL